MLADVNAYAEPKDATMHQGSVGLDTQASGSQATSLLNVSVHRVPLVRPFICCGCSWM
jgi:hypothetical protein